MDESKYSDLKKRWLELFLQFEDIRERRLSEVIRWEWSNGLRYDSRPFFFKRGSMRGRLLRRIPEKAENADMVWKTGYDIDDRVVISQFHYGMWEDIYHYHANTNQFIEKFRFQVYDRLLRGVSRLYLQDRKPNHYISLDLQGSSNMFTGMPQEIWNKCFEDRLSIRVEHEDYQYTQSLLETIEYTYWGNGYSHDKQEYKGKETFHLEYDEKHSLTKIVCVPETTDKVHATYIKRRSGQTLKSITESAESELLYIIPQMIAKANFHSPLYALRLYFDRDYRYSPPTLFIGLDNDRQKILKTLDGLHLMNTIWSIPTLLDDEMIDRIEIDIVDEKALRACEQLQVEIDLYGRYEHGIKSLYKLCRKLNQLDWSTYADVTDDFIVFAADDEYIPDVLRYCGAKNKQLQDWENRGLLW